MSRPSKDTSVPAVPMKLVLPNIADQPDPSVEVRAVYVEEWIEGLAYANPPRLLEQLLENIEALNAQPLRVALRTQLLELHLEPYRFALEFRRQQLPAMTSASLHRQRSMSRHLRRIAMALAMGYKQALSESTRRQSRFASGKELPTLLQRSSLFTALALLHCYDAYRVPVAQLWNEMVTLYKFAAKEGQDERRIACAVDDELFSRTTGHVFKRMCLTSLVDPYHLAHGEMWRVFSAFSELADGCEVLKLREVSRPAGFFVIEPGSDRRPTALTRRGSDLSKRCRLLDANNALRSLESRHRDGSTIDGLPTRVMAAMIRSLGLPPRRHTPRESSEGRVVVSAGLASTHHFLSGGEVFRSSPAPGRGDDNEINIHDTSDDLDFTASYGLENWEIADEGPSGLGMWRDNPPRLPLGVGDLVGLQFPLRGDSKEDWTIAVVRWINVKRHNHHQAGVQILSPQAVPLTVHLEGLEDTVTRVPSAALALPDLDGAPTSTIALSQGLFTPGSRLRTMRGGRNVLIHLGARSEATGSFERFSFRIEKGD